MGTAAGELLATPFFALMAGVSRCVMLHLRHFFFAQETLLRLARIWEFHLQVTLVSSLSGYSVAGLDALRTAFLPSSYSLVPSFIYLYNTRNGLLTFTGKQGFRTIPAGRRILAG